MTRYAVRHATLYEYGGDVVHSHHLLHLQPREFAFQRCLEHSLILDPQPSFSREDVDAFGNAIARLEYDRAHERLAVTAEMQVEIFPRAAESPDAAEPWDELRRRLAYHAISVSPADLEACRFRMRSPHVPLKMAFEEYAADCFTPGRPVAAACQALMRKIHREFKYVPGSTTNRTSIVDVLKGRRGVCQDFAHFMIGCLRSSGLAARYVSGYIRTVRKGGAAAIGGDASHALQQMVGDGRQLLRGDAEGWAGDADRRNRMARVVQDRRAYAAHAFFDLFVIHRIAAFARLFQIAQQLFLTHQRLL